jgi:hypothetical protein
LKLLIPKSKLFVTTSTFGTGEGDTGTCFEDGTTLGVIAGGAESGGSFVSLWMGGEVGTEAFLRQPITIKSSSDNPIEYKTEREMQCRLLLFIFSAKG